MVAAAAAIKEGFSALFEGRRAPLQSDSLDDEAAAFLSMLEALDPSSASSDVLTSLVQRGRAFSAYIAARAAAHAQVAERNASMHKAASLLVFVVDLIAVVALALIVFRPTVKQVEEEFDLQMDASAVLHEKEIKTILASHKRNEQALELSEALLSEMELPQLIPKVLSSSKSLIECEAANLFLVNPRGELCVWSSTESQFSEERFADMGGFENALPRVPDPFRGTVTVPEATGLVQYCRKKSNRVVNLRHAIASQPQEYRDVGSDSDSVVSTASRSESISVQSSIQSMKGDELVEQSMVQQEVERCKLLTGLDVRSMLMCSVYKGDEHVGVIQVVNKKGGPEFTSSDEHLAQVFAANVALAVSNSTLYYRTEQSQILLSTILAAIPSTVLTFSRSGQLINVNHTSVKGELRGRLDVDVMRAAPYSAWLNAPGTDAYMNDQLVEDLDLALREQCTAERMDVDVCLGGQVLSVNYAVRPLTLPGDTRGDQGCLLVIDDVSAHKRTKAALYRYLSPAVADKVLKDGSRLGGKRQQVTTMFSDIRGFTALSEASSPAEVVQMLNEWFTEAVDSIAQHDGVLDKFIGDAFMAEFGVPYGSHLDAYNACLAALDLQVRLQAMNERRAEAGIAGEISVGVGINIGPAICGNIGSEKRLEYTVIGDSVNVASRVEGCTKKYGVFCIITEDTHARVKDKFVCRELDFIKVVGKRRPVRIYELVGRAEGRQRQKTRGSGPLAQYAEGLELYRKADFAAALVLFEEAETAGDLPSAVFAERCRRLLKHCPDDWEPVYIFGSK